MGGVGGVAEKNDFASVPHGILDSEEVDPLRVVAHQTTPMQIACEKSFAVGDALRLGGAVQPGALPRSLVRLDDKGAGRAVEWIRVYLKQPVLVFLEKKREGVEYAVSSEPDILRRAEAQIRLERLGVALTNQTIDAVGGDEEVAIWQGVQIGDVRLEVESDAHVMTALAQDFQERLALQPGEDMATAAHQLTLEARINRVPEDKLLGDARVGGVIGLAKRRERAIREDYAPA